MKMSNKEKKITKKDINRAFWRWSLLGEAGWNYEKMQGLGYCYTVMPFLKKIYSNEDDLQKAVKNHLQFYNTNMRLGPLILGASMAIEEEGGAESQETVAAVKTGLMGPLAGVGDTLFGMTAGTIFGAIAAYMALEGNPIGCIMWILWGVVSNIISYVFINIGYKQGAKVVSSVGTTLKNVTEAATILGMTVIGSLIPTVINAKTPYVFVQGEVQFVLQDMLDKIMPSLLPVGIVALTYWLLGRKKLNSARVIILLIVLGVVLSKFGILG